MSYSLLSESWPVAKKQHRCIWCGEPVLVGEKYRREKSVYCGEMQNFAWHHECDDEAKEEFLHGDNEFVAYSADRPMPLPPTGDRHE